MNVWIIYDNDPISYETNIHVCASKHKCFNKMDQLLDASIDSDDRQDCAEHWGYKSWNAYKQDVILNNLDEYIYWKETTVEE